MKRNSVVFEYDHMCWFGNSYNIKLFSDGTLVKLSYGYSMLGPDDRRGDDSEEVLLNDLELVKEIKEITKTHKEELKKLPKELSNYNLEGGPEEYVKLGGMKFKGSNMFTEDLQKQIEYYKTHEMDKNELYLIPLYEFQKIFKEYKTVINKYCKKKGVVGNRFF